MAKPDCTQDVQMRPVGKRNLKLRKNLMWQLNSFYNLICANEKIWLQEFTGHVTGMKLKMLQTKC